MVCDDLTMNAMKDLSTEENFSFLCSSIFFAVYCDLQHDYDVREPYIHLYCTLSVSKFSNWLNTSAKWYFPSVILYILSSFSPIYLVSLGFEVVVFS